MARVLLVDDDTVILRLLEVNFRLEGFETTCVARGDDAVASAQADPPDAVVLDLMLPGLDGHQVYERLRQDPSLERVPVVFLTARSLDDLRQVPGATYLSKPFDPATLVATVRAALGDDPA